MAGQSNLNAVRRSWRERKFFHPTSDITYNPVLPYWEYAYFLFYWLKKNLACYSSKLILCKIWFLAFFHYCCWSGLRWLFISFEWELMKSCMSLGVVLGYFFLHISNTSAIYFTLVDLDSFMPCIVCVLLSSAILYTQRCQIMHVNPQIWAQVVYIQIKSKGAKHIYPN